jgi:hypothetical protein
MKRSCLSASPHGFTPKQTNTNSLFSVVLFQKLQHNTGRTWKMVSGPVKCFLFTKRLTSGPEMIHFSGLTRLYHVSLIPYVLSILTNYFRVPVWSEPQRMLRLFGCLSSGRETRTHVRPSAASSLSALTPQLRLLCARVTWHHGGLLNILQSYSELQDIIHLALGIRSTSSVVKTSGLWKLTQTVYRAQLCGATCKLTPQPCPIEGNTQCIPYSLN